MQQDTVIIGASISGLACAACLQKNNIPYTIIEKENSIAYPWYHHYDRLHLHTSKRFSNLPYKKFGKEIPRYPSRLQVIKYLEDYQAHFNIQPVFNTEALRIYKEDNLWITETNDAVLKSKNIIMCTGAFGKPMLASIPGIDTFPGNVIHSAVYKTGRDYSGKKVLVIGFGNSACEIAIDLFEQGAHPVMSVRSAVNIIPRDIFGIPVLQLSLLLNHLPARLADIVSKPLIKLRTGNISRFGLTKMPYGALEQIQKDGKAPVLDIGTLKLIKNGDIKIRGDIDFIENETVYFKKNDKEDFDAIIMATGYYRDYANIVQVDKSRFEDLKLPAGKQHYFGKDGLYFCGYWISPAGQIREIALDAKKIATHISEIN
ncbi:MAG: NAD(P)-binding domain-containing protein [Ferruginibacter sp.]